MDLPYKPHFAISCSCGQACASDQPLTPEQLKVAEKDSVAALRMLSPKDQRDAADFFEKHKAMGHDPKPALIGIAPLPKA